MTRRWGLGLRLPLVCVALALITPSWAVAETAEERVRRELEAELNELVKTPAPRVDIVFQGLDEPGYRLVQAELTLDGKPVPSVSLKTLESPGAHALFQGDVRPGNHTLLSKVTLLDTTSQMVSEEAGFKWKLTAQVSFLAQQGLAVKVKVLVVAQPQAPSVKERFKLSHQVQAQMLREVAAAPAVVAVAPPPLAEDHAVAPRPEAPSLALPPTPRAQEDVLPSRMLQARAWLRRTAAEEEEGRPEPRVEDAHLAPLSLPSPAKPMAIDVRPSPPSLGPSRSRPPPANPQRMVGLGVGLLFIGLGLGVLAYRRRL